MVSRKLLNSVLRNITAGKEMPPQGAPAVAPAPGAPPVENAPAPDSLAPVQEMNKPVNRKRYYFYSALPEMSISFPNLSTLLKSPDDNVKKGLIKKLEGGNTGKYYADYFVWSKIVVSTNQYSPDGKSLVVYEVVLNPDGTKREGTDRVYPENSKVTPEIFEKDTALFSSKGSSSNVISVDNSAESTYYNQEPPANIAGIILKGGLPPKGSSQPLDFANFSKIFDEYRIWSTSLNQLLRPDHDIPKTDGVPGGHYFGGNNAFNQLVGPVLQDMQQKEQPQQPSLKDKMDQEQQPPAGKSPFEPVDEQSKDRVQGQNLDTPTGSPMAKKFSAEENYKIKRMARNVLAGYMEEEAVTDKDAISTGTTVKGIGGNPKTDEAEFKELATQSRTKAKKYDEMAQAMKQFNKLNAP